MLYTWLQHTKEDVPQYGDDEWTWMKGALCTIDRPYAECFHFFDWMHHQCYHAVEATRHIKAFLEPKGLYHYDGRSTLQAMWQTAKNCHYVHPSVLPARRRGGAAAHDGGVRRDLA